MDNTEENTGEELWRKIPEFSRYMISSNKRILHIKRNEIMKPKQGHNIFVLHCDKKREGKKSCYYTVKLDQAFNKVFPELVPPSDHSQRNKYKFKLSDMKQNQPLQIIECTAHLPEPIYISPFGELINVSKGLIKKTNNKNVFGYVEGEALNTYPALVHRLVAYHYIHNPEKKRYIRHRDGNLKNNRYDNLQWTNVKEGSDYYMMQGRLAVNDYDVRIPSPLHIKNPKYEKWIANNYDQYMHKHWDFWLKLESLDDIEDFMDEWKKEFYLKYPFLYKVAEASYK